MNPKQLAWEATRAHFVRRLCGGVPGVPNAPEVDFPAKELAYEVEPPRSSALTSHEAAFARLRSEFERHWNETEAA